MTPPSSVSPSVPQRRVLRPLWSQPLASRLGGVALAREKGCLLAWDRHTLYVLNTLGRRQAQRQMSGELVGACIADDGSACAAVGTRGEVWWLAPDLSLRWERSLSHKAVTAALDPFGQYLAAADARGKLTIFDRAGRLLHRADTPRPLHHLAFVPAAPFVVGCADFGLVGCFDLTGHCVWRVGLVAHAGALAVSGDGAEIVIACFTEGLQRYDKGGQAKGRWIVGEPCRLAALTFDGAWTLATGVAEQLLLLDREGRVVCNHALEKPAVGLALEALGSAAYAALADGRVVGLDLRDTVPGPMA